MGRFKSFSRRTRYTLAYYLVRFLIFLSTSLPRPAWLAFCGWLGRVAYVFALETRRLTIKNLTLAFSKEKSAREIKQLSRKMFTMLGKNAGDVLRTSRFDKLEELEKILVTEGFENFEAAYKKGKGVIFVTCHIGAFDMQIMNLSMRGYSPYIIGTPLKDSRLNDLLFGYRSKHGAIAIERGRETFKMLKVLKSGGSVAILIDQDTKVKSVFVDFFGMPAATPVGAAILSMKTGAAIIPTCIHLGEDGLQHMHLYPEIPMIMTGDEEKDVQDNTQVMTAFIEKQVRAHPAQWVWMHERWKTKPEVPAV